MIRLDIKNQKGSIVMRRNLHLGILLLVSLVISALNFGCGGGGVQPLTQSSQSPRTRRRNLSKSMQAPTLGYAYVTTGSEVPHQLDTHE